MPAGTGRAMGRACMRPARCWCLAASARAISRSRCFLALSSARRRSFMRFSSAFLALPSDLSASRRCFSSNSGPSSGSRIHTLPLLSGSSSGIRGTLRNALLSDRLCRIEFCQPASGLRRNHSHSPATQLHTSPSVPRPRGRLTRARWMIVANVAVGLRGGGPMKSLPSRPRICEGGLRGPAPDGGIGTEHRMCPGRVGFSLSSEM